MPTRSNIDLLKQAWFPNPLDPLGVQGKAFGALGKMTTNALAGTGKYMAKKFMPDTTKNYLAPAWKGMRTEMGNNKDWTIDSITNAAGKGIEANRAAPMVKQLGDYGIKTNQDQYGAVNYKDPIDFKGTLSNWGNKAKELGGQAWGWAKENPMMAGGIGMATLGGGLLLKNMFSGGGNQQPQQQAQQNNQNQPYNTLQPPQAMQKWSSQLPVEVRGYILAKLN